MDNLDIKNKKEVVLFTKEEIHKKVRELGKQIGEYYKDKNLLVLSLLKGSFIFAADLVREINIPLKVEFIATTSYGWSTETTEMVNLLYDLEESIEGYDVLIVDDIADSGLTLEYVIQHLYKKNPLSIKSCVLLDKPSRRKTQLKPDYIGFEIPDKFIVGYGLNYGDYYRNIPYIFTIEDK